MTSNIHDVATPAVLVDVDVMERNLRAMADRARAAGVRLRPHAKTHKVLEVGRAQLAAGACGLTLAKTSEAEVFAAAGFEDIFVAFPVVGEDKARRLLALSDRVRLRVGVDGVEGASTLARAFAAAGRRLDVMLKIDTGLHRTGVLPEAALGLARRLADVPGLRLVGIFTHAGHAYLGETPEEVARIGAHEGKTMAEVGARLRAEGIAAHEVSVGSTPTARHNLVEGVTESRPGSYVYNDGSQIGLGVCGVADCAMTVLATVVSVPAPDRAVLDAGSKTLSNDPMRPRPLGFGLVVGTRSRLSRLSEEHGVVEVAEGDAFRVGQRVRVVPNHCCAVSNLHDRVLAVRGEAVEAEWRVAARGRVE